ncbi:MAG: SMP-30/gluconolactonase/LRE family protein [Cyclobacteriaceae bacterium]
MNAKTDDMLRQSCYTLGLSILFACSSSPNQSTLGEVEETAPAYPTVGTIDRVDDALNQVVSADAQLELLAEGFDWSEGPVWVPRDGGYLLFSDIPPNRVYKWQEGDSISLYLEPAGFSGAEFTGKEPGSNGLLLDDNGNLVLCQHGNRQVARMNAPLDNPQSDFVAIVGEYEGKRLNSPNDAVFHSNGDIYFTDPPYGLPGGADSEEKELDFQGVYRFSVADSSLTLLTDEMSHPNGIAFSPDEKTLYVANSDPERAIWMAYDVLDDGTIDNGRVFYDATDQVGEEKGLPDGMAVHSSGHVFATGPGGVWIFNAEGTHLGTLKTGQATANCAFNYDESALYITADMYLMRLPLFDD